MICLNFFWIFFLPYNMMLYYIDSEENLNAMFYANLLASTGDLAFIFHDWLFTEQVMMASLNMPIAIKLFNEDVEDNLGDDDDGTRGSIYSKDKRRVNRIKWLANLTMCAMTLVWYILSVS